jgi:DNA-binding IclR family transcriptional regulator
MASTLTRGLNVLTLLNRRPSATAADLERLLRIPRASVYRILAELVREGFVYKHGSDDGFRISQKVSALSDGLTDEHHLPSLMRPFLEATTRQLRWPVAFCTLSGVDLVLQDNTDRESPLAADRWLSNAAADDRQRPLHPRASGASGA